jgi:hypothetical protein
MGVIMALIVIKRRERAPAMGTEGVCADEVHVTIDIAKEGVEGQASHEMTSAPDLASADGEGKDGEPLEMV